MVDWGPIPGRRADTPGWPACWANRGECHAYTRAYRHCRMCCRAGRARGGGSQCRGWHVVGLGRLDGDFDIDIVECPDCHVDDHALGSACGQERDGVRRSRVAGVLQPQHAGHFLHGVRDARRWGQPDVSGVRRGVVRRRGSRCAGRGQRHGQRHERRLHRDADDDGQHFGRGPEQPAGGPGRANGPAQAGWPGDRHLRRDRGPAQVHHRRQLPPGGRLSTGTPVPHLHRVPFATAPARRPVRRRESRSPAARSPSPTSATAERSA